MTCAKRPELWATFSLLRSISAVQVAATIAAHGNSVSVGMCQGYSAVLLPQLQQGGSQLVVTDEQASWIGKNLLLGPDLHYPEPHQCSPLTL